MLDEARASKCVEETMRAYKRTLGPEPLLEDVLHVTGWFVTLLFSHIPPAERHVALEDWIAVLRLQFEERPLH